LLYPARISFKIEGEIKVFQTTKTGEVGEEKEKKSKNNLQAKHKNNKCFS